jgi:hypothetical protein
MLLVFLQVIGRGEIVVGVGPGAMSELFTCDLFTFVDTVLDEGPCLETLLFTVSFNIPLTHVKPFFGF